MTGALDELEATLQALVDRQRFRKIDYYEPYPKQMELHNIDVRERMLNAGNQEGKTYCAAAETSWHLNGKYPPWFTGRRFKHEIKAWAAGESAVVTRDRMQSLLCGPFGQIEEQGTGFIPKEDLLDYSLSRGVTDAYDTVMVQHYRPKQTALHNDGHNDWEKDGVSTLGFKSYEQGRKKFQSDAMDFIWLDEEPDWEIYSECLTRLTATGGCMLITYTPMQGVTPLWTHFDKPDANRRRVTMTIYDAKHIKNPDEELLKWAEHERPSRAFGIPMMGEGRVYPFGDEDVVEDDIVNVPPHWTRLWGIDFGTGGSAHPFAAALLLWDKDKDCLHVHAAFKTAEMMVSQHCQRIKQVAGAVRVAWPHDGNQKERGSGLETTTTAKLYKKGGLRMLDTFASYPDHGISTEAGVREIYNRIREGKLKIAKSLMMGELGMEFRSYHRKDNLIVKLNDDILSAIRQAVMAKGKGDDAPLGPLLFGGTSGAVSPAIAADVDFPLF